MFGYDKERLAQHPAPKTSCRVRSTAAARDERRAWSKIVSEEVAPVETKAGDFTPVKPRITEHEAIAESERCLKCADAPCSKGCPTNVDIKSFIHAISKGDYYHAARVIYSDNPLGLTCGVLCSTSHQCQQTCNMRYQVGNAIEIGRLQQFACDIFHKMQIPQVVEKQSCKSYAVKIALVGSGPASLSCATFLARLGYTDITIFEEKPFTGGLPSFSIPQFRFGYEQYAEEVAMTRELGVKFVTGKRLGTDFTIESLKHEGYACVFVGVGKPKPFVPAFLQEKAPNMHDWRVFLEEVAVATKKLTSEQGKLPQLSGHVLVLGGGDVAYDTAGTAFRLGAERVTLAFREDFPSMPCSQEEILRGMFHEHVDLIANAPPVSVTRDEATGRVTSVVLQHKDWNEHLGMRVPTGQTTTVKCDHVLVCFGAQADREPLAPLALLPNGTIKIDSTTNATSLPYVFAGGDCAGSVAIVEAVNDAKTAAWFMHRFIQEQAKNAVPSVPRLPIMRTAVDNVDISVDMCGIHFINPYGLSSATPTGCVDQIWRAFEMGWGFAVLKTIVEAPITNISPRIIRAPSHRKSGPNQDGFQNIELLTEKTLEYWVQGTRVLKKNFPNHVIIASIMAPAEKEAWEKVAKDVAAAGPDALELNLSCPHVGRKGFGMLAGQSPELVEQITRWVRQAVDPKIPVFVKLTPNITDIVDIAAAAKAGGADGVTAINTVAGLSNIRSTGIPYPAVGDSQKTAYGGVSGNMIRPIALRAVSRIRKAFPDLPILGVGGIDSADAALQMLHCGASVIQITSAIQDQDYSIVDELNNGLKTLLYLKSRPDLAQWSGQMPPLGFQPAAQKPAPTAVPTVASQIGTSVPYISVVPELDLNAQVRAQVDTAKCLRCGKCYMSCNDTGYCAIQFDPQTHLPQIMDECMGCGLCQSVCPAECITYVRKTIPHKPKRGIRNPGDMVLPFDENQQHH